MAEAEAPGTGTPSAVKQLTIAGQTVELPAEQADLILREMNARDGRHGAELQRIRRDYEILRAQYEEPVDTAPPVAGPALPPESLIIDNPKEWQRQYDSYMDTKLQTTMQATVQALREEQQTRESAIAQEHNLQGRWQDETRRFYERHKDLVGHEDFVDTVYRRNYAEHQHLKASDALDKIADLTRNRLNEIRTAGRAQRPTALETSWRRGPESTGDMAPEAPESGGLTRAVRAQQLRMRGIKSA